MGILVAGVLAVVGCAAPRPTVPPVSVAHHERAAAGHESEAQRRDALYDPHAREHRERCIGHQLRAEFVEPCWTSLVNPTAEHQQAAARHRELAAAHRATSQALRDAEASACAGIDPDDLAISPFEHSEEVAAVSPIVEGGREVGVRIVFRPVEGLTVDGLRRLVACHLARNAALGHDVPEMPTCPLVPRGGRATVDAAPGGSLVATVRSDDAAAVREILRRAEALRAPRGG